MIMVTNLQCSQLSIKRLVILHSGLFSNTTDNIFAPSLIHWLFEKSVSDAPLILKDIMKKLGNSRCISMLANTKLKSIRKLQMYLHAWETPNKLEEASLREIQNADKNTRKALFAPRSA